MNTKQLNLGVKFINDSGDNIEGLELNEFYLLEITQDKKPFISDGITYDLNVTIFNTNNHYIDDISYTYDKFLQDFEF